MPMLQQHSDEKAMMQHKYGNRNEFLNLFRVDKLIKYTGDIDKCFFGSAPTLATINCCYGNGTAQEWLVYYLCDISEFSGVKSKLTKSQMEQLARLLADEYYYLKVTEFMLFFRKFKLGEYGKFYGAVDPIDICSAVRMFILERDDAIAEHEQKLHEKRKEKERMNSKPISYEEYLKRKNNESKDI